MRAGGSLKSTEYNGGGSQGDVLCGTVVTGPAAGVREPAVNPSPVACFLLDGLGKLLGPHQVWFFSAIILGKLQFGALELF